MEALRNEISADLITELGIKDNAEISALNIKIKNAIREVKRARNYPSHYTDEMISKDMEKYYSNIKDIALYDYNQMGAEGQISHSENGIGRTWKDRKECFNGVIPFVHTV